MTGNSAPKQRIPASTTGRLHAGAFLLTLPLLAASALASTHKAQPPVPLAFSPDQHGRFSALGRQHSIHVDSTGAYVALAKGGVLPLRVQGASPHARLEPVDLLPGKANFYYGQDRSQWRSGVDTYAKVALRAVRPGVDVIYYGNDRRLEYDLELAPGTDPRAVVMEVGAGWKASVTENGSLRVADGKGAEVEFAKPVSYQLDARGARVAVESAYVTRDARHFGFRVGTYDKTRKLVIDPTVVFGTFLGGNGIDEANAVTTDSSGNIYVTGRTYSGDFPMTVGIPCPVNSSNLCYTADPAVLNTLTYYAFVTKLNPQGTQVLYSTYLGGNLGTRLDIVNTGTAGYAITVDASGNAYVGGLTYALNFPVLNAHQPTRARRINCANNQPMEQPGDVSEAFLTKLNSSGGLSFSTYFGGTSHDAITGIAVSGSDVWIGGNTMSVDNTKACTFALSTAESGPFPIGIADQGPSGILYGENRNPADVNAMSQFNVTKGFVARFTSGGTLVYGAYTGQPCTIQGAPCKVTQTQIQAAQSWVQKVAIDPSGNILLGGHTDRADLLPLTSCPVGITIPCRRDGFVLKMTPSGTQLWTNYLGKAGTETLLGLAVDSDGNTFAGGISQVAGPGIVGDQVFPTTPGAYQTSYGGGCGFLVKINSSGSTANSTVFCNAQSGSGRDVVGVAVDAATKTPVITGHYSGNLPLVNTPSTFTGPGAFLVRFNSDLSGLLYSAIAATGGDASDVAVDSSRNAVVVGNAQSFTGVVTTGAHDTTYNGGNYDAFVTSVNLNSPPPVLSTLSTSPNPAVGGQAFTLTINGSDFDPLTVEVIVGSTVIANASITTKTATQLVLTTTQAAGTYNITARNGSSGTASNALSLTVNTPPSPALSTLSTSPNPPVDAQAFVLTINGTGFDPASVQVLIGATVIGNASITTKTATQLVLTTTQAAGTYTVTARNGSGGTASNGLSLTVNAPAPAIAPNITGQFSVTASAPVFNRATGRYNRTVTLVNNGAATTATAFVLDNLASGYAVFQPSGFTSATSPAGSPYLEIGPMGTGASLTFTIQLTRTGTAALTYNTRMLGAGLR